MITDVAQATPRSVEDVVGAALAGGAPAIQLRDKAASARELASIGRTLLTLTREAGALLFINDRVDVALAIGADGAHIGPSDLPVEAARSLAPAPFLLGTSTDEPARARALVADGADYIGCGTVFRTTSKPEAGEPIGLERLQAVVDAVDVPVVGIGGVDVEGARTIAEKTGAAGTAVIGAVMAAPDPEAATRALLSPWSGARA